MSTKHIIDRMQKALGVSSDTELAAALGIKRSTVGSWRHRESIPIDECLEIARTHGVSLDWLLLERGDPLPSPAKDEEIQRLQEELAALRTELKRSPAAHSPPTEQARSSNRMLQVWRVLEVIAAHPEGVTEQYLQEKLSLSAEALGHHTLTLLRRGRIRQNGETWSLSGDDVMIADSDEEVAALLEEAKYVFETHVLPGATQARARLLLGEVRVAGEMPGKVLLNALHTTLKAVDVQEGSLLQVVIGLALAQQ